MLCLLGSVSLFYCHVEFCLPSVLFPTIFISFPSPYSSTSFSVKFPLPGPLATEKTFPKNVCFWLCLAFVAACWLSLVAVKGRCSLVLVHRLLIAVASLWSMGSRAKSFSCCSSQVLEDRLDSCGPRALLLPSMSGFPGSGIKLVFPALAGSFFPTELPVKPSTEKTFNSSLSAAVCCPFLLHCSYWFPFSQPSHWMPAPK